MSAVAGRHISESVFALPGSEIWKILRERRRWSTPLGVDTVVVYTTSLIQSSVEYSVVFISQGPPEPQNHGRETAPHFCI